MCKSATEFGFIVDFFFSLVAKILCRSLTLVSLLHFSLLCLCGISTWRCADRPRRCYSNCSRSGTRSIHLVCISSAFSSLGTPLSHQRERLHVRGCVHVCGGVCQASPLQVPGWQNIVFILLFFSCPEFGKKLRAFLLYGEHRDIQHILESGAALRL